MKTERHIIKIHSKTTPVVELDSAASAAYIRFSRHKVARTEVLVSRKSTVTVDFDAADEPIGIELVGVKEFTLASLLESCGIELKPQRRNSIGNARYIRAGARVSA